MNILLLSAGGPTAHGAIKSLKDIDFDGKIVSVDSNPLSAGFYLSDSYYVYKSLFSLVLNHPKPTRQQGLGARSFDY